MFGPLVCRHPALCGLQKLRPENAVSITLAQSGNIRLQNLSLFLVFSQQPTVSLCPELWMVVNTSSTICHYLSIL